ncbi:MAG: GxxExxY protein [Armatimonadetes bacterium]|nr:GxxExxY protein [Armatimonadota bacterium]
MISLKSTDARYTNSNYLLSEMTAKIIACAMEVYNTLGPGFEEVFYQRALHRELVAAGLDTSREVDIEVRYKDQSLGKKRVDFVVEDCLVEIKAKSTVDDVDKIQTLSYLKASGYPVALLTRSIHERGSRPVNGRISAGSGTN